MIFSEAEHETVFVAVIHFEVGFSAGELLKGVNGDFYFKKVEFNSIFDLIVIILPFLNKLEVVLQIRNLLVKVNKGLWIF